jgi:energy-dependent translational throttle protein EttA
MSEVTERVSPEGGGMCGAVPTCPAVADEQYIFTMHRLSKSYGSGAKKVLEDVTLAFYPGAKIGVLGYNGAGKSTVLRLMAGIEQPSSGDAILAPGATVGLLEQEPHLDPDKDVLGNVEDGVAATRALLTTYGELSAKLGEPMSDDEMAATLDEFTHVQEAIEHANAWDLDRQLEIAMDALRCPPADADVTKLSGGERRRVALCRLLLSAPDLLLLDEPTNHLDAESVAWLERFLDEYQGTVVAVTHDRYFLDNVAGWILELDRGRGIPYKGNYSAWLEQKEARLAQEEKGDSARRKAIARELEWVRSGAKARQAKGKARLSNYERLVAEESSGEKRGAVEIRIPPAPRLGDIVVEAKGLTKGYGDRVLIDSLSFSLPKAGIVGVIGPNGAGKTTLFRMIAGGEQPDGGELKVGETVKFAYVDQSRDELNPANNVWKEISGDKDIMMLGGKIEVNSRAYVASFNFKGADQQKPVGHLSGGERNRVHLAKMLAEGGNLLLLDEPSNDLDVDTLRALEDAIESFSGCAVVISHDRWFLDRIATHILAFEGEGEVVWFEGNYAEYEEHRKRTLGAAANQPHRMKYKRLSH